jgi:dipeptidyl aminopeptidase/acylaminoacyl peptidase
MQRVTRPGPVETIGVAAVLFLILIHVAAAQGKLQSGDLLELRSVGAVQWSPDGRALFFTVQERGLVRLYRLAVDSVAAQAVVADRGTVGQFDVGPADRLAYAFTSTRDQAQLYAMTGTEHKALTDLNKEVLAGKVFADVEPLTFVSNDNRFSVEAFLTKPLGQTADSKHPMIVMIHGGPHGQQGPSFNFQSQIYAARGWATLQVNYRGSTG